MTNSRLSLLLGKIQFKVCILPNNKDNRLLVYYMTESLVFLQQLLLKDK